MTRRTAIIAISVLIVGMIATALALLHTQMALRWTANEIQARSGGSLQIGSVNGSLAGPVTLRDVTIKTRDYHARIARVTLHWIPLELLVNRLAITSLTLDQVELTLTPSSSSRPWQLVKPVPPHLPVVVVISDLAITGMQLKTPQLAQPLQIAQANGAAQLNNHEWDLSRLAVKGQGIYVHGRGTWAFRNGEQLDASLVWNLLLPNQPAFSGEMVLTGNDQKLLFDLSLHAPGGMHLQAEIHNLFTAPQWHGKLQLAHWQLQRLNSAWPNIDADGSAQFSGTPTDTQFTGALDAHDPQTGDWQGLFALQYRKAELDVKQLQLARQTTRTRFELQGKVDLADAIPAPDLHGQWEGLALPFTGKPWLQSPHGTLQLQSKNRHILLTLNGSLARGGSFKAQGEANLATPHHDWNVTASAHGFHLTPTWNTYRLPPIDWHLQAHGNSQRTLVDKLTVKALGGTLFARGSYQHGNQHVWQASVSGSKLDPAILLPEFPGKLDFKAHLAGQQLPSARFSLQLQSLHGTLRSAPMTASGEASYAQGKWQFKQVKARIADNQIEFNGHLGRRTRFEWNVQAPDLARIWPQVGGRLDSHGSIALIGSNPSTQFVLQARDLQFRDYGIGKLDARVDMNDATLTGKASLEATQITFARQLAFNQMSAEADGSLLAHTVQLKVKSPYGEATIAGKGELANDIWQGKLQTVLLQPIGAGTWQADAIWQPRVGVNGVSLQQACVTQAQARACTTLSWRNDKWQADATLTAIPLHALQALLPSGLEYSGSFGGSLQSGGTPQTHHLDLTASLSPGSIHNVIRHRRVALLEYTRGNAQIHVDAHHTTGSLEWTLRDGGYLNINTVIGHGDKPALSGRIQGELHDFALIPALIPDVTDVQGKFKIDLALAGTPRDPTFSGKASLTDGAIQAPRVGLNIKNVVVNLKGNGSQLSVDGTADSGPGKLAWISNAQKQNGVWSAQGRLTGTDFRTADIPEAQVDISPALDFTLDGRDITLDGDINIPYAKLRPRNLSNTAQVSSDQVIVGQNEAAQRDRWRIHAKVRATMGDKVDIKGFGLSGRITGNVQLVDEPGHFTTGTGELQIVDGQYTAYGQNLRINRGRLMFNGGPVSNPALDIRAIRKPAHPDTVIPGTTEQQVGVIVRGTLRDPRVSLFSNPPLPQTSLLSYLLTGQLPSTPSQSPLIGQPSTDTGEALTYSGGEFLAQQVGNQIGISDVSIQNVSTGIGTSTPSLFIGKYLSPRLYVSYGTGILQSINTIRIRYTLSARWMLEAESGAANSADLIYTLEH